MIKGMPCSKRTKMKLRKAHLGLLHSAKTKKKLSTALRGNFKTKSRHWKGGTCTRKDGYVLIRVNRLYKFEHRLVIESIIKRPLITKEQVHHIDGNRANNNPKNLIAFISLSAHNRFHSKLQNVEKSEIIFDGREYVL